MHRSPLRLRETPPLSQKFRPPTALSPTSATPAAVRTPCVSASPKRRKKARLRRARAERRRRSAYGVRFIPKQKHPPRKELRSSLGGRCGFQFLRSPLRPRETPPLSQKFRPPTALSPTSATPAAARTPCVSASPKRRKKARLRRARAERRRRSAYGVHFTRRQSPLLPPLLEQPTQAQQI